MVSFDIRQCSVESSAIPNEQHIVNVVVFEVCKNVVVVRLNLELVVHCDVPPTRKKFQRGICSFLVIDRSQCRKLRLLCRNCVKTLDVVCLRAHSWSLYDSMYDILLVVVSCIELLGDGAQMEWGFQWFFIDGPFRSKLVSEVDVPNQHHNMSYQ